MEYNYKLSFILRVYKLFRRGKWFYCLVWIQWIIRLFRSPDSDPLETYKWRVYYAPYPQDIEW